MIADGPAANLPPHIWLEPELPFSCSRSAKVLVPAAALLALAGCDRQSPSPAQPQSDTAQDASAGGDSGEEMSGTLDISKRGEPLPDMSFSDPAGHTLKLADLKGKPVLVNLWATWCGPCVLEMPMLDSLEDAYPGKLTVVTISQDMQGAAKVSPFFASHTFRHLQPWLDPDNNLGFKYNTGLLPTTVLYDASGKEVWRMIGAHDWSSARTDAMLAETLGVK